MLKITISKIEQYDEFNNEFVTIDEQTLILEHSLISISKWESKWKKSFLSNTKNKTLEETLDYIKCMTIIDEKEETINDEIYNHLTTEDINKINAYISDDMTATVFNNQPKSTNREVITAEIIYYWMITANIPFECQSWHLNKLLTLINVCNIKNNPPKKMSKKEVMSRNAALNRSRRNSLNSGG